MKLRIEITDGTTEDEVIVRCGRVDDSVQKLQAFIQSMTAPQMTFYKGTQEYYLQPEEVLFFETEGEQIYAHTKNDAFRVKHKLYELEEMLPHYFIRVAKGTIVNINHIYAINRNITASSQVEFAGTHKQIYVSRHYYSTLKQKMNERRNS
ncbi:MAG: LytTR family transcriptional regulator [Oscillospiraceae bacterium]|nr:LytTR family transcriptional regulator [Oscillospiraceae bacterium]